MRKYRRAFSMPREGVAKDVGLQRQRVLQAAEDRQVARIVISPLAKPKRQRG